MTATMESARPETVARQRPNGEAVAALISPMIGLVIMGTTNVMHEASASFGSTLLSIGSWIPNYQGIGPYSGKETLMLLSWLGSWGAMHITLRRRNVPLMIPMVIFLIGMALATLFIYMPFIDFILGK